MAIQLNSRSSTNSACSPTPCLDKFGCPSDRCSDFTIRRYDTKPPFKVAVSDCNGPMDIQGLVVEANMWATAKLKAAITADDEYFRLADDIGFEQIMVGDIIVMDRVRQPEIMLVIGFDEGNKFVRVERAYRSTTASAWIKGNKLRIFRILNAPAAIEISYIDVLNVDGTTTTDVLDEAYLVYNWSQKMFACRMLLV